MTWLKSLGSSLYAVLAAIAAVLGAMFFARQAGKDSVLKKQAQKSVKAARKANEIRDKNTAAPESDLDKRLRKYQRQ